MDRGGHPPPLTDNHCAQKSLAERGGNNGQNPLSSFWQLPLFPILVFFDGGVLFVMPGSVYLCVLCVYVVADRGRCVQLWPLFPLPPVISETYPTVLSILARYWSAFIWCTVSSDTESNNIFRYEHWTYILCPVAGLQLDFHLMPSLVKYSFPCHAINLRFLIKMFLHIKGQESDFSSQLVIPIYELYRCISSHCYPDHAWWFARSVHLFRYAPHKRTNIQKISPERSLEIHLFLVPM